MARTTCWGDILCEMLRIIHTLYVQVCDRLMMELEKPPEEMSLAVLSDQLAIARKNFDNLDVTTF